MRRAMQLPRGRRSQWGNDGRRVTQIVRGWAIQDANTLRKTQQNRTIRQQAVRNPVQSPAIPQHSTLIWT